MKLIKFIKYWWKFNIESEEPSMLFVIIFITFGLPILLYSVFMYELNKRLALHEIKKKEFWENWRKINE